MKKIEKIYDVMDNAVKETMEGMAFMLTSNAHFYSADIDILKPQKGKLSIFLPNDLLKKITEASYGDLSHTISKEVLQDTVGEIANTIAGIVLSNLIDTETSFELGLPEITEGHITIPRNTEIIRHYNIDNELFIVTLSGKELIKLVK